ncbi:hypothetical protein DVR09_16420 (plasmid) [Erythrobacter aureus]|uniref:Uncharacterized protein n=2 Tax=Erythrobacter aureus TaxID=2182384 RepID=A0A345YJD5_9SPHN|nr:hypothetical protein DVR09_16420 [Erythrobacter aureus]
MAFLSPLLSFIGCLVMAYAGCLLITRSKKPSYLKTIKSRQASQAAGIVVLLLGGGALLSTFAGKSSQIEKIEPRYVSPTIPQTPTPIQLTQPPRVETPVRPSQSNGLAYDTPFPANGKIERTLALTGNIAQMEIRNLSGQNMIAIWYYNTAVGDQEAARMYITAGQSARIDLPTFDYRLAGLFANPELGLVRGFTPNQIPRDFGFIDLKRPARMLSSQPTLYVKTYGQKSFRPGYEKHATR